MQLPDFLKPYIPQIERGLVYAKKYWQYGLVAVVIAVAGISYFVKPVRAYVGRHSRVLLGDTVDLPTPIPSTPDPRVDALEERLVESERMLTEVRQQNTQNQVDMVAMRDQYMAATAEVATTNSELVKQQEQLNVLLKAVQSTGRVSSSPAATNSSGGTSAVATPSPTSGKININTANLDQLDSLPGIGPSYAQRIIDYRTEHGPFKSVADLDAVEGIGASTIEKIKDLVEV